MTILKLFDRVVARSIRRDRFLTALSVLGVALGVGLFLGVNTATNRAVSSFESTVAGIDPAFNYEVRSISGIDFADQTYRAVNAVSDTCLPVLVTNAVLPNLRETVEMTAIYTARAATLSHPGKRKTDIVAFLSTPNGVLVSQSFARNHGIEPGDSLSVLVYSRRYDLTVVDVVDLPTARAAVLMDLGNFQDLFHKTGQISRIDLIVDERQAADISRMLPAGLSIQKKQVLLKNRQSLIDAFRYNLRFVTFLAVLVGVFLLYNTVFMSVMKRRAEIGILRGLGMDRSTLVGLFSTQGVLLGLAGSLLGVGLGQAAAWVSSRLVGSTITRFYGAGSPSGNAVGAHDVLWTLVLALGVSFGASFIPALESAGIRPMESVRAGTFERDYRRRQSFFSAAGALLIACGIVLTFIDYRIVPFRFPWLSHGGILLFILGCTLNAPAYLQAVLMLVKPGLSRLFKAAGRIAAGDISGTRYRFSLALMSVAVSSALIVAIVSSVYSLKRSFIDWITTYISADIYIKPASCTSNFCIYPLPDDVARTVEKLPGVETVGRFRSLQLNFRGMPVVAGFGTSALMARYTPGVSSEERQRMERLARYREVSVSEYLAVKYRLKKGDVISIETPKGEVPFTINNTSISYSTLSGFLYFDRRWLQEYWGLDDATQLSVYLEPGYDRGMFMMMLKQNLKAYALDISDTRQLRESVLQAFDRSFAVTYAIEFIAIVISLIGVVNALLILVLEKKREISVLRYLGAGWDDIRQIMALSAAVIGAAGILLGAFMGAVISLVITHVVNRISFGWEVAFQVPWLTLLLLMAVLFSTTVLASIIPSAVARKIDPKAFVSFE